jgi:putative copper resistance protein D
MPRRRPASALRLEAEISEAAVVKLVRVLGPAALLVVAFAALVAALEIGGGASPTLIDSGAFVRWGLPVAKLLMNLGVAVTIGALALAVFALSDRKPEYGRALDIAAAGAAVWAVAGCLSALLTFSNLANIPFALDDSYGQVLGQFLTGNEIGRAGSRPCCWGR